MDTGVDIDPRRSLAYEESVRALTQQGTVLDALRTRTGILLAAISISASFLGAQALAANGLSALNWLAIAALGVAGGLSLAVLWPRGDWHFSTNADLLIEGYIDTEDPATVDEMHVELAKFNQARWKENGAKLDKLFGYFRWSALALVVEVAFWLLSLGT